MEDALNHTYLNEGRLRFHQCMCTCCTTNAEVHCLPFVNKKLNTKYLQGARQYAPELDPKHKNAFDPKMEKELSRMSMFDLRDKMYNFVMERQPLYGIPLCINPHSAAYKNFARCVLSRLCSC